jgi:hypothetical protein
MNEQLQIELLGIIKSSKEGVLKGIELAGEQAPELIEQIILFETWSKGVGLFFGVLLIVFAIFCIVKFVKRLEKTDYAPCPASVLLMIGGGVFFVLGVVSFTDGLFPFIKVMTAPKLYLLEYIGRIIGG